MGLCCGGELVGVLDTPRLSPHLCDCLCLCLAQTRDGVVERVGGVSCRARNPNLYPCAFCATSGYASLCLYCCVVHIVNVSVVRTKNNLPTKIVLGNRKPASGGHWRVLCGLGVPPLLFVGLERFPVALPVCWLRLRSLPERSADCLADCLFHVTSVPSHVLKISVVQTKTPVSFVTQG